MGAVKASRRTFLQAGLAASVLPGTVSGVVGRVATGAARIGEPAAVHRVYKAVWDRRFPQGAGFSQEAERRGVTTVAIDGDITDFWFHDLSLQWKNIPVIVAGLTAHGALFCLERWAWDHRMRVVFRGEHQPLDRQRVGHLMAGHPAAVAQASVLMSEEADWERQIARVITTCPAGSFSPETAWIATPSSSRDGSAEPLFSWVIA